MLRYEETVNVSVGPRQQIHAKLVFNESFQREIQEKWRQINQFYRLSQVGILRRGGTGFIGNGIRLYAG